MKIILCFFVVFIASTTFSYEIVTDGEKDYLLVPLDSSSYDLEIETPTRAKRQTSAIYDTGSRRATFSHMSTLLDNDRHNLMGSGSISGGRGPLGVGGSLDYTHKPSASSLGISANHLGGMGTDIGVSGRYNIINKPNTQAFVGGSYERHLGGPGGNGRPNPGVVVGFRHRF